MAFDIITDTDKGISALVDREWGRALGPIVEGEGTAEILRKFADAVGVDPATVPSAELERTWKEFVMALDEAGKTTEQHPEAVAAAVAGTEPAAPAAAEKPSEVAAMPGQEPPAAPAAAAPTPAAAADTHEAQQQSAQEAEQEIPRRKFDDGYVVCETCNGFRTIAQNGQEVECPTCKGTGEVLGPQPEPAGSAA